jgi:hypothetical protein
MPRKEQGIKVMMDVVPQHPPVDNLRYMGKYVPVVAIPQEAIDDNPEVMGRTNYQYAIVRYNPYQSPDQLKDTLIHEPFHLISEQLDLNLSERQVRLLATGYLALLRDNPEYAKWLIS